jgi:hypothetical protein
MARRIGAQPIEVAGVRGAVIAKFQRRIDRLPESSEVYDFTAERDQLLARIAGLEAGEDVEVQGWEIPRELRPASGKVFRLTGDQLVPQDYEKVG